MSVEEEVRRLKEERNAVLLAHNYQLPEVQDIADYVGDSLYLSRQAMETDRQVIVFAGVRFMAETAKILNPTKTVLLPDLTAGCSLADAITAEQLRTWKSEHPGAVVVSYVNTSAEVKAESDYCCTSSNAIRVVNSIPADREILFLPDMLLGDYVRTQTGRTPRTMHLWPADCHVHGRIRPEMIAHLRSEHPGAPLIAHPECGCASESLPHVDQVLSTDGMVRFAKETKAPEVLVATEVGILHRMRQLNPTTRFTSVDAGAICPFMKKTHLADVRDALKLNRYEIDVRPDVAERARRALERMVAS